MSKEIEELEICNSCLKLSVKAYSKLRSEFDIMVAGIEKLNKFMTGFDDRTIECEMNYSVNKRYVYLIDEVGTKLESASTLLSLIKMVGEKE